jgi:Asp-tRNA(Asn)/Glu-tRNA(Gln) amidotransferase C subunit
VAISFKEFVRRILRDRKPTEEFSSAVDTYRDTLQRLRTDINEFVERELSNLTQMMDRASEVAEDLLPLVKKLREEKYAGLMGKEMDHLWRNCADTTETLKMQAEMADFIRIKDEELKAISEHFENLNKMEVDKEEPTAKKEPGKNGKQTPTVGDNSKTGKQDPSKVRK